MQREQLGYRHEIRAAERHVVSRLMLVVHRSQHRDAE